MIYALLGPTCSSKSDLAEKLSLYFNYPVINFDAYQIYKELNKGTAKPSKELLDSNRYFLYDFVHINEDYDVAKYQMDGRKILKKFSDDNVILVGGTGLYLKALLYDYKFFEEEPMPHDFLNDKTNDELYDELIKIDNDDALKIGKNNRRRLLRALYIYKIHGKNKTSLNENGKKTLLYKNIMFVGINPDREVLYKNIEKRTNLMVKNGLEEEAKTLFKNYSSSLRALKAIGYNEFLKSNIIDEVIDMINLDTKHYAKRQLTFFKHQFDNVNWFNNIDDAFDFIRGKSYENWW